MKIKTVHKGDLLGSRLISQKENCLVIKLNDGNILKIFHPLFLLEQKNFGIDIEAKILDAVPIKDSPEILVPQFATYSANGQFLGYISEEARGIDFNKWDDNLSINERCDLKQYAIIHSKLEEVLRKNPNIVFPDFCTCDNIFVDSNGNVSFIDYDGLQVGKHRSVSISTSLGSAKQYLNNTKYFTNESLFTKELDKKSSIFLYFLDTFNVNLNKVGMIDPSNGKPITLNDIFSFINLDDDDLCHKTWKIFQNDRANEYLGDDVFRIADKYNMNVLARLGNSYIKRLTKKW